MALFHLSVTQTKRSAGQSAIASAAYRAGERLYSEYYGEYSDYTRKGGVICSDILLPSHAPPEYADRQTLWNAVEKAERGKNAQLAYSFDIALAMYEKHGQPLEKIVGNILKVAVIRPKQRPYQTNNFYAVLKRQEMLDKEVYDIVHRNKKMAASDVRENRGKNCAAGKDKEKAVPRR